MRERRDGPCRAAALPIGRLHASASPPRPGSSPARLPCAVRCSAASSGSSPHDDRDTIDDDRHTDRRAVDDRRPARRGDRHGAHPPRAGRCVVGFAARGRRQPPHHRHLGAALIRLAVSTAPRARLPALHRACPGQNELLFRQHALAALDESRIARPAACADAGRPGASTRRSPTPVAGFCAPKGDGRHERASRPLAALMRASRGVQHKRDIAAVVRRLGIGCAATPVAVGDDCRRSSPTGDGHLLFAIEGLRRRLRCRRPVVRRLLRRDGERQRRARHGRPPHRRGRCHVERRRSAGRAADRGHARGRPPLWRADRRRPQQFARRIGATRGRHPGTGEAAGHQLRRAAR